ncbi:MAG: hypothetical protein KAH54_08055 [Candidatus Sabulitectum sp.]|nr:hypothetical protein [Candidatus Sabulitectum sp.]
MKKIILIGTVIILGLASGCGDKTPSGPSSGSDAAYYPLSVGNQWVYDKAGTMSVSGIVTGTITGSEVTDITDKVSHASGFDVFVQAVSVSDTLEMAGQIFITDTTYTTYMNITDEGLHVYTNLTGTDSTSIVPFPLEVGLTWQFSEDPPMTGEILSLTETVNVPAGTFENCLEMKLIWIEQGNTVETVTDFAPNVGKVKYVYTQSYSAEVITITSVLMSYSVD